MDRKKIMKSIMLIVLAGVLLLTVGCADSEEPANTDSTESKSINNIRSYLNEQFDGPNQELIKIWDMDVEDEEKLQQYYEELEEYRTENLKPIVSDRFYETRADYNFLRQAYSYGYELNTQEISIEESEDTENSYNITAQIEYSKSGSTDSKNIELRGLMNTNEEGKIKRFIYHNYQELDAALGGYINTILGALQREFNGPDEELEKILEGLQSGDEQEKYAQKFDYHIEQHIKPFYNLSDRSVEDIAYRYIERAYVNRYELKTEDINVEKSEESEDDYTFTVDVSYSKNGSDDWKTITLEGSTTMPVEDARITEISYSNDQELLDALGASE